MPTFTAKLVLDVTAHLPSEREFRRHCAQWVESGDMKVERWELDQLGVIPHAPAGKLLLHLCTVGNPDHEQYASVSEPEWHVVASLAEARERCCDYLEKYSSGIGGGNWGLQSGRVTDSKGAEIAKFSFKLRCWSPAGAELPCTEVPRAQMPKRYIVLGPDGVPIREKPFANRAAAERGVTEFVNRFRLQGYYAGAGYRLELDQIAARCTVQECGGVRKRA